MMTFPKLSPQEWLMEENRLDYGLLPHYESIFALANGYMGVRASLESNLPLANPGFYIAGVYDQVGGFVHEIVNMPCWIGIGISIEGFPFDLRKGKVLEYKRVLDMRQGSLFSHIVWRSAGGHTTCIDTVRILHLEDKHGGMIWGNITPLDYSADIGISNDLDAWCVKYGSPSGQCRLGGHKVMDFRKQGIGLEAKTLKSRIKTVMIAHLDMRSDARRVVIGDDRVSEKFQVSVQKGKALSFVKRVSVWTSRDSRAPLKDARAHLALMRKKSPAKYFETHRKAWQQRWDHCDIRIKGDARSERALRFNSFHLTSIVKPGDERVSLGAKGLHGNGYAGMVFWDTEIFMLPFYVHTYPEAAKTLLMYRWHFLDDAYKNGEDLGHVGAFYPWNSSVTGRGRHWTGWQEHVGSDIAYGIDWYVKSTGDRDFWLKEGADVFLGTARYWQSRVKWDKKKERFVILKLGGPDEIHTGVDNNAYTNILVKWHLQRACELVDELKGAKLWNNRKRKLKITDEDAERWRKISDQIYEGFKPGLGIHEQFEGYLKLKEKAIDRSRSRMEYTGRVQHSFKPTKVAQQADTPLLYWMLDSEFPEKVRRAGYHYYDPRCSHTSSLSRCIYSALAARIGLKQEAYRQFLLSAESDIAEGAEHESETGVHTACMGGTWLAAVTGFAGIWVRDGKLSIDPCLPAEWQEMRFNFIYRGKTTEMTLQPKSVRLRTRKGALQAYVKGKQVTVNTRAKTIAL